MLKNKIKLIFLICLVISIGCENDKFEIEKLKSGHEIQNYFDKNEIILQDTLKYNICVDSIYYNQFGINDSIYKEFERKYDSQLGDTLVILSERQYKLFLSVKYVDVDTIYDTIKCNYELIIHGFNIENNKQKSVYTRLESKPIHVNSIIWTPDSLFIPDNINFISNKPYVLFNAFEKNESSKEPNFKIFIEKLRSIFRKL